MISFSVFSRTAQLAGPVIVNHAIAGAMFILGCCILSESALAAPQNGGMIQVSYRGKEYVGKPLARYGSEIALLRRDGRYNWFPADPKKSYPFVSDEYEPYSITELRAKLQKEFGRDYRVSVTNNFVVVHPHGSAAQWAQPFEKLYWRFRIYFKSLGVTLGEPQGPMIAVILNTEREYERMLSKKKGSGLKNTLGYYNSRSNRIITFAQGKGANASARTHETIVHEAAHQTAYNVGIHNRYAFAPRYISEGLAQLFEAKGISNSSHYARLKDRVNPERLYQLKQSYRKGEVKGVVEQMVLRDDIFRTDQSQAYAVSWGLAFYLAETKPKQYAQFLADDGARGNFTKFTSKQRAAAFAKYFGTDFKSLEARMKSFYAQIEI